MKMTASEFKAKCLAIIDRVHQSGEPVVITKRGRVVAKLEPHGQIDEKPWLKLRHMARWSGDPLAPVIEESDIEALK